MTLLVSRKVPRPPHGRSQDLYGDSFLKSGPFGVFWVSAKSSITCTQHWQFGYSIIKDIPTNPSFIICLMPHTNLLENDLFHLITIIQQKWQRSVLLSRCDSGSSTTPTQALCGCTVVLAKQIWCEQLLAAKALLVNVDLYAQNVTNSQYKQLKLRER